MEPENQPFEIQIPNFQTFMTLGSSSVRLPGVFLKFLSRIQALTWENSLSQAG